MLAVPLLAVLTPHRRWYQFRLTTWFMLVAILAWALTLRPWIVTKQTPIRYGLPADEEVFRQWERESRPYINPSLLYPALAFTSFVGWKCFWLIVERRRNRSETRQS